MARTPHSPPLPGASVRGSSTGRPVMAAMDLLGRRWSLRILWELRDGATGARALRQRCDDMSTSVMYDRLAELAEAGLVTQSEEGDYQLTPVGSRLGSALAPLDAWAQEWADSLPATD